MSVKRLARALAVLLVGLPGTVLGDCETTLALVDFGQVNLREGDEITGRVTVRCDLPGRFEVRASAGHGSFERRELRGPGGSRLLYNLYVDPARSHVWGDGINAGTATLIGTAKGRRAVDLVVYGRIFAQPSPRSGAYADNLHLTVER